MLGIRQTKEGAYAAEVGGLKGHIHSKRPNARDEELNRRVGAILKMMFLEDDAETKARFKRHWDGFMTWLLLEAPMRPDDLLGVLKLVQKTVRSNRKRYGGNIDFYFNPDVYKLSFRPRGLFERREKNTFLRQILRNYGLTQQAVLKKPMPETKIMGEAQTRVILAGLKEKLRVLRDAVTEENEIRVGDALDAVLDELSLMRHGDDFDQAKKMWYETVLWVIAHPTRSKAMKLRFLRMVQDKARRMMRSEKKRAHALDIFPEQEFRHSLQPGFWRTFNLPKQTFLRELLDHVRKQYNKNITIENVLQYRPKPPTKPPKKTKVVVAQQIVQQQQLQKPKIQKTVEVMAQQQQQKPKAQKIVEVATQQSKVVSQPPPLPFLKAIADKKKQQKQTVAQQPAVMTPPPPLPFLKAIADKKKQQKQTVAQQASVMTPPPPLPFLKAIADKKKEQKQQKQTVAQQASVMTPPPPLPFLKAIADKQKQQKQTVVLQQKTPAARPSLLSEIKTGMALRKVQRSKKPAAAPSLLSDIVAGKALRKIQKKTTPDKKTDAALARDPAVEAMLRRAKVMNKPMQQQQQDEQWQ